MSSNFDEFLAGTVPAERAVSKPCALGVRIRLARNLAGEPFPGQANSRRRREIMEKILIATEGVSALQHGFFAEIKELSAKRRNFLVERRYISPEFLGEGCGALISRARDISLMINEEDHLRAQVFAPGDDFDSAWKKAVALDKALSSRLDFAFSEKYGFLTACPTNAGTGLRVSVMLHLPGFVTDGEMDKIFRALHAVGLTVRGAFGESSESHGCIFQISNEYTLGVGESETLELLRRWTKDVVEQEMAARRRILARERTKVYDRVARAYGNLRYAVSLSANESVELLSLLRLACDYGFFGAGTRERFDELFMETGTAHIACRAAFRGKTCETADENLLRGRLFRETLSAIRPPEFPEIN